MPRYYKRKTKRTIDEQSMKHGICAHLRQQVGLNESARRHNIKRSTLQLPLKIYLANKTREEVLASLQDSGNESDEQDRAKKFGNEYAIAKIFTVEQERELSKYLKHASDLNYGLSFKQVQKLAYQYAKFLPDCKIPQQWIDKNQAGDEWRKGFMNRNKDLSLRKPESTSLFRGTGFNKSRVEEFFQNYTSILERYGFIAQQIYNLDETGISTVMKPVKVVSSKGKKQVGQVASGERGELVTFVGIVNATGSTISPIFVYPRIRNVEQYMINGPLGNKSGWMTAELFLDVLKHIVNHTRCSRGNKILLIVDNHGSHTSVPAILFCRQNGIVLLFFPPHTTHRLQPLDVGINSPFKTKLAIAFNDWMLCHPGRTISIKEISELANIAYLNSFTPKNIISSFQNTGIWPMNRLIFTDQDFAPSSVTDKQPRNIEDCDDVVRVPEQVPENERTPERIADDGSDVRKETPSNNSQIQTDAASSSNLTEEPEPSTSTEPGSSTLRKSLLEQIRPFPKIDSSERPRKKRRVESKSRIYTDNPELNIKQHLEKDKERKRNGSKKKSVVKKVFQHESSSSDPSESSFVADDTSDEESFESLKAPQRDANFDIDDFVLVKFRKNNKKEVYCYYIGKIILVEEKVLTTTFLRRRGLTSNFHFATIPDISVIPIEDVTTKLSAQNRIGNARVLASLRFNYNFQGYDLR